MFLSEAVGQDGNFHLSYISRTLRTNFGRSFDRFFFMWNEYRLVSAEIVITDEVTQSTETQALRLWIAPYSQNPSNSSTDTGLTAIDPRFMPNCAYKIFQPGGNSNMLRCNNYDLMYEGANYEAANNVDAITYEKKWLATSSEAGNDATHWHAFIGRADLTQNSGMWNLTVCNKITIEFRGVRWLTANIPAEPAMDPEHGQEETDYPSTDKTLGTNYMASEGFNFYPDPLPKERRELRQHTILAHKLMGGNMQEGHSGTKQEPRTCLCPTLPTEDQGLLRAISRTMLDKSCKGHKRRTELRRSLQTILQIRPEQRNTTRRRGIEISESPPGKRDEIRRDPETSETRKKAESDCCNLSTDVLSSDEADEIQPTQNIPHGRPLLSRTIRHGEDDFHTPRTLLPSEQGMDRILSQNGGDEPLLGRLRPTRRRLVRRPSHTGRTI